MGNQLIALSSELAAPVAPDKSDVMKEAVVYHRDPTADVIIRIKFLIQGLGVYGCPNYGVSHWLWSSPLQQCYALPCYTVINISAISHRRSVITSSVLMIMFSIGNLSRLRLRAKTMMWHRNLFSVLKRIYVKFTIGLLSIRKISLWHIKNKEAQLTQRERATAVHVWRPTANKCKIRKNLYFTAQGHSRSLFSVSIETRVWIPISD